MGDMLSQAEIDALLKRDDSDEENYNNDENLLTSQEVDALGEIGNISMGTSATTLYSLLGQRVEISTPQVALSSWDELEEQYSSSHVGVKVEYTDGLNGMNLLLLKEKDVKVITELMMGGDVSDTEGELNDLHLSAIGEAMNQMIGSAATSMSSMLDKRIGISPPKAFSMKLDSHNQDYSFADSEKVVKVAFRMVIGDLIDSEIMQLLPLEFAKSLVGNLMEADSNTRIAQNVQASAQQVSAPQQQSHQSQEYQQQQNMQNNHDDSKFRAPINVQPAQFQAFDDGKITIEKKNIGLIMDVPLQVTVELGRTNKLIKDILEFGPGSIIELDKLAGEPVDILVNGKVIAKGEVVVIDESFGVRITDITHPSQRL
jgi:flagellar motor switch protein FliN/FliY